MPPPLLDSAITLAELSDLSILRANGAMVDLPDRSQSYPGLDSWDMKGRMYSGSRHHEVAPNVLPTPGLRRSSVKPGLSSMSRNQSGGACDASFWGATLD